MYKEEVFTKYVSEKLNGKNKLLHKLAVNAAEASEYPGFDAWYTSLNTKLTKERVLKALRLKVRSRASEERGKYYLADWYSDKYLQAAVISMADKAELDFKKIEEYSGLAVK